MVPGLLETAEGTMVTPAQLAAGRIQTRERVQLAINTKFDTNAKSVAFFVFFWEKKAQVT